MLFDLQSRRRRTAVKIIYLLLAVLMAGGLVLLGVGTGSGNGGFLNSLTGNGSNKSTGSDAAVTAAVKAAEKEVAANPNSASAYGNLVTARFDAAGSGFDQSTETYTAAGKALLSQVIPAWTRYAALVKGAPDPHITAAATTAYDDTGSFAGATVVWQDVIAAHPTAPEGYQCLALTAYAAKKTALAEQAAAKAVALTPKVDQLEIKDSFTQAAKSPSDAGAAAVTSC